MRIGIILGMRPGPENTLDGLVARSRALEARGFDSLWLVQLFGFDAVTALALVGRETDRAELGTAVVPIQPRHPLAMAQQALAASAASGGRFTLGVGLSHAVVIEGMLGLSYATPARHMREYLEVLEPLLRGEAVDHIGERYRVKAQLRARGAGEVPVLVAALGPVMLRLAGERTAGTVTWMCGPRTLAGHVVPRITGAAREAGRPAPRIVAGLPVVVTDDVAATRAELSRRLALYGQVPSYRTALAREGIADPADLAIVGDEARVGAALEALAASGVTDLAAAPLPRQGESDERTLAFLASHRRLAADRKAI